MTKYLGFLLMLIAFANLHAQQTVVRGTVKDFATGETLPFVSVFFKDTKIGVTTDINGKYELKTYYATDTLVVVFVGYARKAIKIKLDEEQTINIGMLPSATGLQEVTITADKDAENPAHPIIRRVIANKPINDREKLDAYQYEAYNKVEFDLNNLNEELRNKRIMRPFKFIFDNIDSTGEKPYLPVFISEAISDLYFRRNPKAQFEYIKATKVSGIENQSITQFLGDIYQGVNIYDNNIIAFNRSFISPISNRAFTYYKYYLVDSLYIDDSYCYQIDFLPRRKQEPTFTGSLWINDTTYAIKKVEASIAEDANVNFVNSFFVRQEFNQVEKEVWMLVKDQLVIDFNISDNTTGLYGRKTSTYRNHVINKPKPFAFYNVTENIQVAPDAKKEISYWDTARHEVLTEQEKAIYAMVDSVKGLPQFKSFLDILNIVINGYKTLGPLDIGPYSTFYSFNPIEGNRFRFGGTTNKNFSKRIIFDGYLAYGLKDEQFKYNAGFYYFLSKKPRTIFGANYKHDVEQLGQSQTALAQGNVLSSVFRRSPATKLTFATEHKVYLEHEWFSGFSNRLSYRNRQMQALGSLEYKRFNADDQSLQAVSSITTSELSLFTRFAYKERFVYGEFERISLGTRFPVFSAELVQAIKGVSGSQFTYTKLYGSLEHDLKLGIFGRFNYRIDAGKIIGRAPYPLLEVHKGNETFFYNDYAFNTMNFFEFVSDQFTAVALEHHFEGFFLNRIPLLRKLKWREVAGIKGIVGTYNNKNSDVLALTDNLFTLNRGPYLESAIGIENIFKVLRLDLLYRMRYLDNPNIVKLALRAKFQFNF